MSVQCVRLILGDQLNQAHSWFAQTEPEVLYLIAELRQETDYVGHHLQKVCAFFSAMAAFANWLTDGGHRVRHLTLDDTCDDQDLPALLHRVVDENAATRLEYQRPDEWRVLEQLRSLRLPGVTIAETDTEHFLLPFHEIRTGFQPGKHRTMEFFYRAMRKRFDILMQGAEPLGGRWNFDSENRRPISAEQAAEVPEPLQFANEVSEVLTRIERHGVTTIGRGLDTLPWPIDRSQSLALLEYFVAHLLSGFGRYQDAMTRIGDHQWSLYHSRLSFAINVKLLSPLEVVQRVVEGVDEGTDEAQLAAVEGFVRQIIGWREFVRAVYWANMPDYSGLNALDAKRQLPGYFWTGDTRMQCLHKAINQSLERAYAHHIQRLMITGNFCLLAGIEPQQVDAWYLGIYIDALDWVELPNTRGMSQFADGGVLATKPYCAGGAYVNRMSDYCGQCAYNVRTREEHDSCPLNSLYWHFLHRHRARFEVNPRMKMAYRNLDRMDETVRQRIMDRAEDYLTSLECL